MENSGKPVSIVVVDDHPLVRWGLQSVFHSEADIRVVGEAASAEAATTIAEELKPDIILLDLDIPGGGENALREIQRVSPNTRCVILTVCESTETAIKMINLGAKGYILKGASARDIRQAVRTVIGNASFIAPEFAVRLLQAAQRGALTRANALGVREKQVLAELENGLTNKQIARKLQLSERTVKHYMSLIMERYGVSNRVAALMHHKNGDVARI